jgi:hypothetical protein
MIARELLPLIDPRLGPKYSPNLHAWIRRNWKTTAHQIVATKPSGEFQKHLYIGILHDGRWISGSHLREVLGHGARAKTWALNSPNEIDPTFWPRYIRDGRCAIDPDHTMHFIGDETRWKVTPAKHLHRRRTPEMREFLWCGHHVQVNLEWTETVHKSEWVSA